MRIRCSLRGLPTAEVVRRACGDSRDTCTRTVGWRPNVTFLKKALTVPAVTEALSRAVDRLIDHSEHEEAARVREDLPLLTDTLQARCAELPGLLEATEEPGRPRAWS